MLLAQSFSNSGLCLLTARGYWRSGLRENTPYSQSPWGAAQISLSLISISEARLARTRFETDQVSPVTAPAVGSVVLGSKGTPPVAQHHRDFFFFLSPRTGSHVKPGQVALRWTGKAVSSRASTPAVLITSGGSLRWWNWAASPLLCGPALESAAPSAASDDGCLMAASVHRTHLSSHQAGLAFASNAAEPGPM